MTDTEKVNEWVRHYEAAHLKVWALVSCLKADGEKVCALLLKKLKLNSALDVLKVLRDH